MLYSRFLFSSVTQPCQTLCDPMNHSTPGHGGKVWQNVVHWRREWQTTSVFLPWEPMNSMKRPKDRTLKDELPRLVGAHYATGNQWRNNSRKNEGMEPKWKHHPVVNGTGDGSRVQCCKEQYCIWIWNVRSMNQGKLDVVKQEMTGVNIDILGINELRWTGMGQFNSDDHYIYYCGQESLGRNGVAITVNKRVWNGYNLKDNRMISVRFQGKPFNIMIIQVYAPTSNAEEVEQFYEDLQDLLELTPKKRCPFHYRGLKCKSRKSRNTWSNRQIWPLSTEWSRTKANRGMPRERTGCSKQPFPTTPEDSTQGHHQMVNTEIILIIFFAPKMEKLYIVSKNKTRSWLWLGS